MNIMVVMPAPQGVMEPEVQERVTRTLLSYAGDGVDIHIGFPTEHTGHIPRGGGGGALGTARNHIAVAERMAQAEKEGMNAVIPYGMSDYGAALARSHCSIPVVGQSHAAYTMAALMADRWGIITYQSSTHSGTWAQLQAHGLTGFVAGLGGVDMHPREMWNRSPVLLERFTQESKRLVAQGAELIVCHGMSMSPIEYRAPELTEAAGVPVLEGMGCAVALAQAWHRLGTPTSRVRYPMH